MSGVKMTTQQKSSVKFESAVSDLLAGDKLSNILEFYSFLKENKLSVTLTATNSWTVKYKGKRVCYFRVSSGYWFISYFKRSGEMFERSESYITTELKDFIHNNIKTDLGCSGCVGDGRKVILGKEYDTVCWCHPIWLNNPDGEVLRFAKELVLIGKNIVADMIESGA